MNYIGIRGHRGAGKSSVAYLLGNTLNLICQGHSKMLDNDEIFSSFYNHWCKQLMESENCINEADIDYVYFESFSDQIKTFIRLLLGCPEEYLYEDKYKDSIVINLRDLSCKHINSFPETPKLVTAQEFYKSMPYEYDETPVAVTMNTYMMLREFIMYFGLEVMQRFFGRNVWVKSLKANSEMYDSFYELPGHTYYKLFIDLKTPAEATYIKQANGVIVNVTRPDNKKGQSGLERLGRDTRIDYNIVVNGDLYSIKNDIINIAKDITNKFKNNEQSN
jgi:hypothetical protein